MKPEDFQIDKGNEIIDFKRGVMINDRSTEIKAVLTLNNKKGIFHIDTKISSGQITGKAALDKATLKLVADLIEEAIKYGMQWRKEWVDNNAEDEAGKIEFD
jgi:hypothetical protein